MHRGRTPVPRCVPKPESRAETRISRDASGCLTMAKDEESFGELPQALVEDVLNQSLGMAGILRENLTTLKEHVGEVRGKIGRIDTDREIAASTVPTSCGIDGSYIVERLLSTDLAALAVLAVEGLTPPSEKRHWPQPRHLARLYSISHDESTQQMMRGTMMCHELGMARQAPHDVVMLDWGFKTPVIYLNNATQNYERSLSPALKAEFRRELGPALQTLREVTAGERSDRSYVGLPKYSTVRELSERYGLNSPYDDRTLASLVLRPGEYLGPISLAASEELHIQLQGSILSGANDLTQLRDEAIRAVNSGYVVYYKPRQYLPAFRLEISARVAKNRSILGTVLRGVEFQCAAPGIFEPFPLYLADRMVKHLSTAFPAFLQSVTHEMATGYAGDLGEIFLTMHSYRSEGGR